MARTTGNRYSATLQGSVVTPPGVEYYIEASDGISTVRERPARISPPGAGQRQADGHRR